MRIRFPIDYQNACKCVMKIGCKKHNSQNQEAWQPQSETLTTKLLGNTPITHLSNRGTKYQVLTKYQIPSEPMLVGTFIHNYLTKIFWTTVVFIHEGSGAWQVK